ncbi:MAG: hypothetical protein J0M24_09410 [Verrucomicrobia bacterium]|nr:hypothetical protein [Verrucomicrobiota bacterium]
MDLKRNLLFLSVLLLLGMKPGQGFAAPNFSHFEGRQVHPLAVTPNERHLLAVNTLEGRLSVFRLPESHSEPILISEIPVGLEPVSVRARTDDEVWVVNEVSDSVAIVSLSENRVVATLSCPDEPSDVVFTEGLAWVSCSRSGVLRVFDVNLRTESVSIPLTGNLPRALAVNSDGSRIYVAFQHSGNRTTILPAAKASPQIAPTNPELPPAVTTAEIVRADDPRVTFTVLDHDVAEVSVTERKVLRYFSDIGTTLFHLAVRPGSSELWITATDSKNHLRYEPQLKGRFIDHRLAKLRLANGTSTVFDLNPGIDPGVLPNPAAQATALAEPTSLLFADDGQTAWVAAFGSDRIARIDLTTGQIVERLDLRLPTAEVPIPNSRHMRGPRGLAWSAQRDRLYVLNKLSSTVSVVNPSTASVEIEVPLGSVISLPPEAREGRGFLFDARLSGNGLSSCGSCHPDADIDGLAWDLGDPSGQMTSVIGYNFAVHETTPRVRELHPMKGPMTTQTLRGLRFDKPLHWRGDRATLNHFNVTFRDLLGGQLISEPDMSALESYLRTLRHHPNPNRTLDNALAATVAGGNPTRGRTLFNTHNNHCSVCHVLPDGSDHNLDDPRNFGGRQPMQTPSLETVYQRAQFNSRTGESTVTGFGLGHDGIGGKTSLPTVHFYDLDELRGVDFADVTAFLFSFDTGTAPAVGHQRTISRTTATSLEWLAALTLWEGQAARTNGCDLVVVGQRAGERVQLLYAPEQQLYLPADPNQTPLSREQLLSGLEPGEALTFLGTLPGDGSRWISDHNGNGIADTSEPTPLLKVQSDATSLHLQWSDWGSGWLLESAATPAGPWLPNLERRRRAGGIVEVESPNASFPSEFHRLRRLW